MKQSVPNPARTINLHPLNLDALQRQRATLQRLINEKDAAPDWWLSQVREDLRATLGLLDHIAEQVQQ